ncbi:uncharacterized protein LOC143242944 isoform X3 [Tachypleus tridentatus]|uniref:uncharacterized protein LOC143242944 isoform X3 n=1 Tax=Tachypleus tridentatus TaxID=6853 RepID=UPI003FD31533
MYVGSIIRRLAGRIVGYNLPSSPKPDFQQVNGRRSHIQKSNQENITPQHEEITRYIHDTCVQPSENHQCPEGFTLRNNLCYPSQTETEEETYVPSPRKTPSMLEYPIPLVTAAVGVPLLFISLSVIIWKCNSCGCEAVKSANTEDHTNKDDRTKIKYSLVPQKDEDQTVIRNEKRKCKSVKEKRAKKVQNFHLPKRERKANVFY